MALYPTQKGQQQKQVAAAAAAAGAPSAALPYELAHNLLRVFVEFLLFCRRRPLPFPPFKGLWVFSMVKKLVVVVRAAPLSFRWHVELIRDDLKRRRTDNNNNNNHTCIHYKDIQLQ